MAPSLPLSRRKAGRFWIILACLLCLGSAVGLILNALSGTIIFFMAPSQLLGHPPAPGQTIRLGGMVVAGSLHSQHDNDSTPESRFDITDGQAAITVEYRGILPDLFREGQSVVALGHYATSAESISGNSTSDRASDGTMAGQPHPAPRFIASEVLAKHDETYMPREVADALQKSGKWDPRFGPPPDAASWDNMTAPQQPARTPPSPTAGSSTTEAVTATSPSTNPPPTGRGGQP